MTTQDIADALLRLKKAVDHEKYAEVGLHFHIHGGHVVRISEYLNRSVKDTKPYLVASNGGEKGDGDGKFANAR